MIVISNSSPLIALSQIGRLELLGKLHAEILISPAVAQEVEPSLPRLPAWILVRRLSRARNPKTMSNSIGLGEQEVVSLGLEIGSARLILDERPARRLAFSLGFSVIGTLGLLLAAKRLDLLTSVKPELDRLVGNRFFMDEELYHRVLAEAGE